MGTSTPDPRFRAEAELHEGEQPIDQEAATRSDDLAGDDRAERDRSDPPQADEDGADRGERRGS